MYSRRAFIRVVTPLGFFSGSFVRKLALFSNNKETLVWYGCCSPPPLHLAIRKSLIFLIFWKLTTQSLSNQRSLNSANLHCTNLHCTNCDVIFLVKRFSFWLAYLHTVPVLLFNLERQIFPTLFLDFLYKTLGEITRGKMFTSYCGCFTHASRIVSVLRSPRP